MKKILSILFSLFLFLFLVGLFGGSQVLDPVISDVTKDYPVALAGIEAYLTNR